ncbi:2-keto-3-deoxygluconate permease, partial [Pseudomonas oryzihabitans]
AAVATPHLVAQAAPTFAAEAPAATALVAVCVVLTAVLTPIATSLWATHVAPKIRPAQARPAGDGQGVG